LFHAENYAKLLVTRVARIVKLTAQDLAERIENAPHKFEFKKAA
jgi:hypothetical protein